MRRARRARRLDLSAPCVKASKPDRRECGWEGDFFIEQGRRQIDFGDVDHQALAQLHPTHVSDVGSRVISSYEPPLIYSTRKRGSRRRRQFAIIVIAAGLTAPSTWVAF